jgi:hypothetical protein
MPVWRLATALKFPPKFTPKPLHFGGFVLFWWDFFATFHGVFAPIYRWLVRAKRAKYLYETERNHRPQDT